ncbi:MAG: hypothetical protein ACRDI1_11400 [Actinomycetota bacterium]|jgi:hypothetical protein
MNFKRLLLLAVVAFAFYYLLRSPDTAAEAFRVGGQTAVNGLKSVADSLARFIDALVR